MKCKKLAVLALTGAMTLSLAAPSFAADANSTVISGAYKAITIDVSVPATGSAVINPYSMPVKAIADDSAKTELTEVTTAGKIATNPLVMYNKTTTNLTVNATVTTTVPTTSGIELVETAVKDTTTDKQAQVYLEAKRDTTLTASDMKTADATTICGLTGTKVITAFNNWAPTTYNKVNASQLLLSTEEPASKEGLAIMSAGKTTSGVTKPEKGSFVLFRLAGTAAKKPDTAWVDTDTFQVNVAFTFSPLENKVGGAISATTATAASNVLAVAAPANVSLTDATYKWEVVSGGTSNADGFADETLAAPSLTTTDVSGTVSAGTVNLKCTVSAADGNIYVSTGTVTLS